MTSSGLVKAHTHNVRDLIGDIDLDKFLRADRQWARVPSAPVAGGVFVAAEDATAAEKTQAGRRLCDNVDDDVQIIAAINQSGAVGLSSGTFTIGAQVPLKSTLEIGGTGWNRTILKAKTNLNTYLLTTGTAVMADIYLHDFKVDGNSANQSGNGSLFGGTLQGTSRIICERIWFYDAASYGAVVENASNAEVWFVNCKFSDFTDADALECLMLGAKRMFVLGCIFDNNDFEHFISVNGSSGPTESSEFVIAHNIFKDLSSTSSACVDLFSTAGGKSTVRGTIGPNIVINCNSYVLVYCLGNGSGKVDIVGGYHGGRSEASSIGGVWVQAGAQFPVVVHGGIYESFDSGLYSASDDVEFEGVIVENTWSAGVTLAGNRNRLIGGRVRNSRRKNAGTPDNVSISGDYCEIRHTHISDTGTAKSTYGLHIESGAVGTIIDKPTVTNGGTSGNIQDDGSNTEGEYTVEIERAFGSALFNAVGLTDSETIFTIPAGTILLSAHMVLATQFAATGMTDLDVTLGDAGDNDGWLAGTMNLTSDAVDTKEQVKGAYFDATAGTYYAAAATNLIAYATAVGANLSTLTAGKVTFYLRLMRL